MKTFCQLVHFFHPHVGLLSLWFMVSYIATQMYPKCTSPKTIWYDSSLYNRFHLPSVDMYWKAGYYVKNYMLPLQCEDLKQPCEFAIVQMWYHKAVSFGASILKWTYRKKTNCMRQTLFTHCFVCLSYQGYIQMEIFHIKMKVHPRRICNSFQSLKPLRWS